jgi:hypothetical protein
LEYLQEHHDDEGLVLFSLKIINFIIIIISPKDLSVIKKDINENDIKDFAKKSKPRVKLVSESVSISSEIKRRGSRISSSVETSTETKATTEQAEQSGDTLIEAESAAVGSVAYDVYFRYFKSIGVALISIVLIFAMSSEASSVMSNSEKIR